MILTITIARKPVVGSVAQNVLKWQTGGLNIGACRIGVEKRTYSGSGFSPQKFYGHDKGDTGIGMLDGSGKELEFQVTGRWPANLILSHLPDCEQRGFKPITSNTHYPASRGASNAVCGPTGHSGQAGLHEVSPKKESIPNWKCAATCPVCELDTQSGERPGMSGGGAKTTEKTPEWTVQPFNRRLVRDEWLRSDSGGASRFFKQVQET